RAAARAQLDAQMLKLKRREELLVQVFEKARAQLPAMAAQEDWPRLTQALLREAIAVLDPHSDPQGFVVHSDAITHKLLEASLLTALSHELNVELALGDPLPSSTGVLVTTHNGRRQFDNTLETRFGRLADELRSSVYSILTGNDHERR
ncbi:MAG: V-type ATP synthase subunit E family protein, partial [Anaerolineae bacterium]|nr:V-type ATP synthase subunit E family protein [Anaerolineae bacterium]